MKIAYSAPAKGEVYVTDKKAVVRAVRSLCPELPLLAFQTMHVPKMDLDIAYLATLSSDYIRVLSIREEFMSDNLRERFSGEVLPYICRAVMNRRRTSHSWPSVLVVFEGMIREVSCSDGWLFPSKDEIIQRSKKIRRTFRISLTSPYSEQSAELKGFQP